MFRTPFCPCAQTHSASSASPPRRLFSFNKYDKFYTKSEKRLEEKEVPFSTLYTRRIFSLCQFSIKVGCCITYTSFFILNYTFSRHTSCRLCSSTLIQAPFLQAATEDRYRNPPEFRNILNKHTGSSCSAELTCKETNEYKRE